MDLVGKPGSRPQTKHICHKMISISISVGELADRLTILKIKSNNFDPDSAKGQQIQRDLEQHRQLWQAQQPNAKTQELIDQLRVCNQMIWDLEERRRKMYQVSGLAKTDMFREDSIAICLQNDRRASLKQAINESQGSLDLEVKSHPGL